MTRCLLLLYSILFFSSVSNAQQPFQCHAGPSVMDTTNFPDFYLDGVKYSSITAMGNLDPNDICEIRIQNKPGVKILYGRGPDSCKMVIFTTKSYARKQAWEKLSRLSTAYNKLVPTPAEALKVAYIVNNKLRPDSCMNYPGMVNEENLIRISIIHKGKLKRKYGVTDKEHGVVIKYRKDAATTR